MSEHSSDSNSSSMMEEEQSYSKSKSKSKSESESESESDSAVSHEDDLPDYDEVEEMVGDSSDPKVHEMWENRSDPNWFENLCCYFRSRNKLATELAQFSGDHLAETMGEEFRQYGY
jgi:hypothetical protein